MPEGKTLTEFLNDEPTEVVETPSVEAAPEPAPEPEDAPSEPVRDEKGRFAAKDAEEPQTELPKEEYKAIREEREKRQNLERELEALRTTVQQLQQPKEPPAPPPSLWDDEQGWQQHQQRLILTQADQLSRINASEMAARSTHADFQEMFDLFNTMATQNPAVVQQAMADPHPWNKAYEIAKNHKTMTELGAVDVADLEAKIEARLREEIMGQSPVPQQPTLPPSLTGERNVGTRSGPAWSGPMSLAERLR
jgi:hypothetical protein